MIVTHLIDLTNPETRLDLYTDCLRLRREVFISSMGWNLHESFGCEFDQYDIPASVHLAAVAAGKLVGCLRLLRTDSEHSGTTYMILDAHRGNIPNLPANIMQEELASSSVWEASRLAVSPSVEMRMRNSVLVALITAARSHVVSRGGVTMLGLMNPIFLRTFRRAGFAVRQFGPVTDQRDGRICVLRWDFETGTDDVGSVSRSTAPAMLT
ncbi:GNAT family N-acetyltransferase [Leisingera sp. M658]|nr:GNAT family N-acetyltransferase [Leisingera sp. M658]